jgi:hypothetical protein
MLLDLHGGIPASIRITNDKVHGVNILPSNRVPPVHALTAASLSAGCG